MGGAGSEYSVVREHEEFLWLHTAIEEHPAYAGYIVSLSNDTKGTS